MDVDPIVRDDLLFIDDQSDGKEVSVLQSVGRFAVCWGYLGPYGIHQFPQRQRGKKKFSVDFPHMSVLLHLNRSDAVVLLNELNDP